MEQAGVQLIAQGAAAFDADMKSATSATNRFVDATEHGGGRVSKAGQIMTGALREIGALATQAFVQAARATVDFVGDSVKLAGEFDQTMSVLQATSEATAEQMGAVADKAKELGADLTLPATSAVDAGEAMLELSKAGFTVVEAMDAAKGVLQLAAAAQIDEARAAEINANALNAFGLEAKDSIFVSDLLAASANASSVEITDVAQSYQMAGAVFASFQGPVVGAKESLIQLTTAIGLLGNAGIKGSDAGTALKQSLLQLSGPSMKAKDEMRALFLATQAEGDAGQNLSLVLQGNAAARAEGLRGLQESAGATAELGDIAYDAAGNMRSFPEILNLVSLATKGMTAEMRDGAITTIFGADAMRAILVLMNQGPEAWGAMEGAVTRQGAAADLAAAQTAGYKGALEGAKSQVETLQLTIGQALTPVLADLLNNYISPSISAITAFAQSMLDADDPVQALVKSIDDLVPGFASFVDAAETGIGIVIAIGTEIDRLIGTFAAAEAETHTLGGAVNDLSGVWAKAQLVIGNVMDAYMHIAQAVLPIVTKFVDEHGDEIAAFFKKTWDSIIQIITLALDLYNTIVPPVLNAIAGFIDDHGSEILKIMGGAWDMITSLISGTLDTIVGVFKVALALLHGDWQGAWTGIQGIVDAQVKAIGGIVTGFLNLIAGIFDTSLSDIAQTWENNWNMLVEIVTKIDWAEAGMSVVEGIIDGVASMAGELFSALEQMAQDAYDAFMKKIAGGSPAQEFVPAGQSIAQGIMQGLSDQVPGLMALINQTGTDMINALTKNIKEGTKKILDEMNALIDQVKDIGRDMQAAIADSFGATASIDRQVAKNLDRFKDVLPGYEQFTTGALKEAQSQAEGFLDPVEGAKFFQMRSNQILEYAKLQKGLADEQQAASDAAADQAIEAAKLDELRGQLAVATTEKEIETIMRKIEASQLAADADIRARHEAQAAAERIEAQMLLINEAQAAELSGFNANQAAKQSAAQQITESISAVMAALSEIDLTDEQIKIVDMLSGVWAGLQAPVQSRADSYANPPMMSSQYAGGGGPTSSSTKTINMPIYTNNSPAALQQSWAVMQASMP